MMFLKSAIATSLYIPKITRVFNHQALVYQTHNLRINHFCNRHNCSGGSIPVDLDLTLHGKRRQKISGTFRKILEKNSNGHKSFFRETDFLVKAQDGDNAVLLTLREKQFSDVIALNEMSVLMDKNVDSLTDTELKEVVYLLKNIQLNSENKDVVEHICKTVDKECVNRLEKWSVSEMILLADLWSESVFYKYSSLLWCTLKKNLNSMNELPKFQVVQLFYYLHLLGNMPGKFDAYKVESLLLTILPSFTLDEMVIVISSILECQKCIKCHDITLTLMEKLEKQIGDDFDPYTWNLMFKVIQNSIHVSLTPKLNDIQEKVVPLVPKLSCSNVLAAAVSGIYHGVCNKNLLTNVVQKCQNVSQLQSAELERFLKILSTFNVRDEEILSDSVDVLRKWSLSKKSEILRFVRCVKHLCYFNIYPPDLIEKALSEDFRDPTNSRKFQDKLETAQASIDYLVGIERPDYGGPRMPEKMRAKRIKILYHGQSDSVQRKIQSRSSWYVTEDLDAIYGQGYHQFRVVTPPFCQSAFSGDILFTFDKNLKALPCPKELVKSKWGEPCRAPDDGNIWLCMIIGFHQTWKREFNGEPESLLGDLALKIRLVEAMGWKTMVLNFHEYAALRDSVEKKQEYIKTQIENKILSYSTSRATEMIN